ncbi:MEDS domain-containing protein [Nitrosomonas ureae]|uniref:Uncharacterized protein n=1 Tax=Nitrosomonas ureae TaxID=44577 RepID=A0A2T5IST8_9PROT|nr:MEDS domain-containing protein [Nitrosomonas ureae]PTQ86915.1 hypothetical protein C8R28_1008110 [Nitrosomonas ureae]
MNDFCIINQLVKDSFANNHAIVVILQSKERIHLIEESKQLGIDIEELKSSGRIKFFDAGLFLSNFVISEAQLDTENLKNSISHAINNSKLHFSQVLLIDGMIDMLLRKGNQESAVFLENQIQAMASQQGFDLYIYDSVVKPVTANEYSESSSEEKSIMTSIENSVRNGLETAGNTLENLAKPSPSKLKSFTFPI